MNKKFETFESDNILIKLAETKEELEHWYDETYQMCLLAFLRIEHIDRKKAINELKKKVEAKEGNT